MIDDEAAFWALLKSNPNDDTARLVFADWLDDRADPRGPWVRKKAFFERMGTDAANFITALIDVLGEDIYGADDAHEAAADALRRFDGAAVLPHLLAALDRDSHADYEDRREFGARVLAAIRAAGHAAVADELLPAVVCQTVGWFVLGYSPAAEGAAYLSGFGPRVVPLLLDSVRDLHRDQHGYAVRVCKDHWRETFPLLIEASRDPDEYASRRRIALCVLADRDVIEHLGEYTDEVVAKLVGLLDTECGGDIEYGLEKLGPRGAAAVPGLVALLDTDNPFMVRVVVPHLARIATPDAVRAAVFAATGRGKVKQAARDVLREWKDSAEFLEALGALVNDGDAKSRKAANALLKALA